jgi:PHD/YefM family antitoxin component YafN of YafNO toxin-antitoxin module
MATARKSQISVTSRSEGVKNRNAALARRLAGNVHGAGSRGIPLKEPERWHTYIANTFTNEDEFYRMRHEKGWEPLTVEDLDCSPQEAGFRVSEDGSLVRGAQGKEMVFKMPKEDYHALQMAKTAQNLRGIGSAAKVKSDIAEAAGAQLGDEAASFLNKMPGQVVDGLIDG